MLIDEAKIRVSAGRGGDGAVSFRHEKYVPRGGPDGGDGGDGGSVIFKTSTSVNSLFEYYRLKNFKAESGYAGARNRRHGKDGKDLTLAVPVGTVIFDVSTKKQIVDLDKLDQTFVICKGGKGGLGNTHFASATHQTPREFKQGEPGEKRDLALELKMIAEVGIIGQPNAGKSTLISAVSGARPKVADYPFTTLEPVLGVARYDDKNIILCDIPGLIEGAAEGKGLGHKFLRHIERTKILLHLIDSTSPDPKADYDAIRLELKKFNSELLKKDELVVLTKIDLVKKLPKDFKYDLAISAATGKNIKQLLQLLIEKV